MMGIDSEGGLGINLNVKRWIPLYFKTEAEARQALKELEQKAEVIYFNIEPHNDVKAIYHEVDNDRFVIFVEEKEE